ncbi:hypothetical protein [Streptomyces sp. MJM8645]|uniref:hypothetical protein n=1 Tax=Streptomycetaceae TaxID=2062 RepID=UPI000AE67E32|nr:hypothetical protein [Streptomyces sp. MJM8645]
MSAPDQAAALAAAEQRAELAEQANERLAAELRRYGRQIDELRTEAHRGAVDPGRVAAALERVNQLAGFVYRRAEQERRQGGDGVSLRKAAYAHGAADTALSAGRPDQAAAHIAHLVGQAERWREHAEFASLGITVAAVPDGAVGSSHFAPGDIQTTSFRLAPDDDSTAW